MHAIDQACLRNLARIQDLQLQKLVWITSDFAYRVYVYYLT